MLRVLPAEACDIVGGEACAGEIGAEVKLKVESPPMSSSSYNHDMDD